MKRVGKLCICLAGGLVLNAGLRAADAVLPNNPYAPIATRNVFGITPPPLVDPNKPPAEPPPKITPNGIMSIFGHLQALFKVAVPAKQGQPGKDQFYSLGEGQAQDDIEVTKIDEKASIVTFNNHGAVQELPLASATAGGSSGPAQGGPASMAGPNIRGPGFAPAGNSGGGGNNSGFTRFGTRSGQSGGPGGQNPNINGGNNFNGGMNGGSRFGAAATSGGVSSSQPQTTISADDQAVLVTANHALAVAQGDPSAIIYPPSEHDAEAGVPSNVAPPPSPGGPVPQ